MSRQGAPVIDADFGGGVKNHKTDRSTPSSPSDGILSPSSKKLLRKRPTDCPSLLRSNSYGDANSKDGGEIGKKLPLVRAQTFGSPVPSGPLAKGSPTDELLSPVSKKVFGKPGKSRVAPVMKRGASSLFAVDAFSDGSDSDAPESDEEADGKYCDSSKSPREESFRISLGSNDLNKFVTCNSKLLGKYRVDKLVSSGAVASKDYSCERTTELGGKSSLGSAPWIILANVLRAKVENSLLSTAGADASRADRAEDVRVVTAVLCTVRTSTGEEVLLSPASTAYDAVRTLQMLSNSVLRAYAGAAAAKVRNPDEVVTRSTSIVVQFGEIPADSIAAIVKRAGRCNSGDDAIGTGCSDEYKVVDNKVWNTPSGLPVDDEEFQLFASVEEGDIDSWRGVPLVCISEALQELCGDSFAT
jgi:hypothetical protein